MASPALPAAAPPSRLARFLDSDLFASFKRSKLAMAAFFATVLFVALALLAPVISPQNPYDPAQLELMNASLPPIWYADGQAPFLIGTDDQGRDVLSAVFYGMRLSLLVGVLGVLLSGFIGIGLGLIAGYAGGLGRHHHHARRRRAADLPGDPDRAHRRRRRQGGGRRPHGGGCADRADRRGDRPVVLGAVCPHRARLGDGREEQGLRPGRPAHRPVGAGDPHRHILPNVTGPVFVIATINLALAIITEATLSFLGTGLPETMPSLGTLIRTGNRFLFSGEWWIVAFPGLALAGLVLAINLLGDWLRDALNPKLQ